MRQIIIVLAVIIMGLNQSPILAQQVLWERSGMLSSRNGDDWVVYIYPFAPNQYRAIIQTDRLRFRRNWRFGRVDVNLNGQLSNQAMLDNDSTSSINCIGTPRGYMWEVRVNLDTNNRYYYHKMTLFDQNMVPRRRVIHLDTFNNENTIFPRAMYMLPSGKFCVTGVSYERGNGLRTHQKTAMYDSTGQKLWDRVFVSQYGFVMPERIEPTPRGTLLISGANGPDIYIYEIDSLGRPIDYRVLYTHPDRRGWDNPEVYQHQQGYIIKGTERTMASPKRSVFMFINRDFTRRWGSLDTSIYGKFHVNSDGTFWGIGAKLNGRYGYFTKWTMDSLHLFDLPIADLRNLSYVVSLDVIHYTGDGSAIIGGFTESDTTNGWAYYLTRIDRIGAPYNPAVPLSVQSTEDAVPTLIVSPNPARDHINISTRGEVQVQDILGKVYKRDCPVEAGARLSLEDCPRGLLLVTHTDYAGRKSVRKIVRE